MAPEATHICLADPFSQLNIIWQPKFALIYLWPKATNITSFRFDRIYLIERQQRSKSCFMFVRPGLYQFIHHALDLIFLGIMLLGWSCSFFNQRSTVCGGQRLCLLYYLAFLNLVSQFRITCFIKMTPIKDCNPGCGW